jgi:UDP-2,4-diacetamido-2,4,6-trideoxy-beta-L-altropyranose hydrolase
MSASGSRRQPLVAIRVDGSATIGGGHLARCLTLADQLADGGADCHLLVARLDRATEEMVAGSRHLCHWLPASPWQPGGNGSVGDAAAVAPLLQALAPEWLVVDHYRLDAGWERRLAPLVGGVAVIDDLANRSHDCNLLLDQNLYPEPARRYRGLLAPGATTLLGPDHALLRREFVDLPPRSITASVRRILLFFGSTDPTSLLPALLDALPGCPWASGIEWTLVTGAGDPGVPRLQQQVSTLTGVSLAVQVDDIASRLMATDLAVGAVGSHWLERAVTAVPTVATVTADNQREVAAELARRGAIALVDGGERGEVVPLLAAIEGLLHDQTARERLSQAASSLMAGWRRLGGTSLARRLLAGAAR